MEFTNIADQCSTYVLSPSKEHPFKGTLNHLHHQYYMQHEILKEVLKNVETCFEYCGINGEELDNFSDVILPSSGWLY